jgi:aminopeptidase N
MVLAASKAAAQRLPATVVPSKYVLAFDVDLARARFTGTETIAVTLSRPSRRIVLHALDIQFQDVTIVGADRQTRQATVAVDARTETAALNVLQPVPAGDAEIHIKYTGILNDKLRGFYLSKANGRNYAVTQLESTDARRAFPSFDEPAFKATFALSVTIDQGDTVISNGRALSDTPGPGAGRHTMTFAETPKMSTYLVAMAVGDFSCLEGSAESIPIRICATPDKKELGHIALGAAEEILRFYNRYYTIKYPFGKLDVVAVPDFAAGAMENTAAIFYREVDLLADAKTASVEAQKRIWAVLAHEMAHQWFGDLVTMKWWDDLWLNEGFATWMEKRPLAAARPEWRMDVDEVSDAQAAMNLDSLASTRSIHTTVETSAQIEGSFDTIAYEKGASVMRMIEGYVGADGFQQGVNAYLQAHAYGNATSEDFWTAMSAATGKPIDRILPEFVNRPGVPVFDAALLCDNARPRVKLTNRRFFLDPAAARSGGSTPAWRTPICVKTPTTESPVCDVVSGPSIELALPGSSCPAWAFVNAGATGYYRTAYSSSMLRALATDLSRLNEAERLSLVADEWAMVRAGVHHVSDYLTLAAGLGQERTSGIVSDLANRLSFVHDYLTTDRTRGDFEQFVRSLFGPALDTLGLSSTAGEDDDRRALRAAIIDVLGDAGNDTALSSAAQATLDRTLAGTASLDPSAASAIVEVAARHGDAALWEKLWQASRDADSPALQYRYLFGLGAFSNPALIDRGLNLALTPAIRSQDTASFLARFLANPDARPRAWSFIKDHWAELTPKVSISFGDVRIVESTGVFCDTASRDDVRTFFVAHPLPAASRTLDQTLERITNCAVLRQKQTPTLTDWLANRSSK